uniref:Uncharacterized protein n=1 Tax=Schizaphis graminum TaxID=13262 RepID=A0A2S2PA22_SCHGA
MDNTLSRAPQYLAPALNMLYKQRWVSQCNLITYSCLFCTKKLSQRFSWEFILENYNFLNFCSGYDIIIYYNILYIFVVLVVLWIAVYQNHSKEHLIFGVEL